jgi:hypothetical protein
MPFKSGHSTTESLCHVRDIRNVVCANDVAHDPSYAPVMTIRRRKEHTMKRLVLILAALGAALSIAPSVAAGAVPAKASPALARTAIARTAIAHPAIARPAVASRAIARSSLARQLRLRVIPLPAIAR